MPVQPWLDGFTHVDLDYVAGDAPEIGRAYDEMSRPKVCLHTTEGDSIEGAEFAFRRYPPHIACEYEGLERRQYLPLTHCSYSMKGDENDDEFVVQVEIVGHAGNAPNFWEAELAWIGAQVLAPIWRAGVQFEFAIPAQGYHGADEGITPYIATAQSPIRFSSEAALRSFSGVIGHQHAPAPDCVAPETPILCADLIWRAAGDLVVGDELVAVEESPSDRWGRTLLTAVVERNWIGQKECARVITDRAEIVASVDHPWLVRDLRMHRGRHCRWVRTGDLDPEHHEIVRYVDPWQVDRSWSAGWLAGLYDADGSLMLDHRPRRGLVTLAFSHIGGPLADEFTLEMERRGFNLTVHEHTSRVFAGDEVCVDMRIKGGPFEVMRALGVLRPQRLLRHERMRLLWEGRYLHKTTQAQVDGGTVPVLGVEPIGAHAVASLQTSSRTYIANGFVCHNTHWDPGRMNVQRMLDACTAALGVPPLTAVTPTAAPVGDLLWPILRTSTRGACPVHTRVVQQVCGATVDGDFYIATAQAVRGYQNAIGLPGNGVVGKETGTAIVKNVLRDLGYAPLVVDGNYDAATTAAVIQFQAASGIAADGFFEGQTTVALWYAMGQP